MAAAVHKQKGERFRAPPSALPLQMRLSYFFLVVFFAAFFVAFFAAFLVAI